MKRYLIILLLILINLLVIFYIDYRINMPDLNYYNGKDGGLIVRFESTIILSVIYFFVLSKRNRILYSLYGFIVGLFSMIICYLIIGKFTKLNDIFYQLTATILFIIIFHSIRRNVNVS